jgi:hypothetical protein
LLGVIEGVVLVGRGIFLEVVDQEFDDHRELALFSVPALVLAGSAVPFAELEPAGVRGGVYLISKVDWLMSGWTNWVLSQKILGVELGKFQSRILYKSKINSRILHLKGHAQLIPDRLSQRDDIEPPIRLMLLSPLRHRELFLKVIELVLGPKK